MATPRALVAVLLALGLALPALADALPVAAEAPGATPASEPTRALLWRVTDAEGRSLHLLGSIHLADASIYPLPQAVEAAFTASQVVAVEADVVNVNQMALQQRMMQAAADPEGRALSERLPPDLYAQTAARLRAHGTDIRMLEPMRPWFVAIFLTNLAVQHAGLSTEHGIEHHFIRRAGERPVVELEGVGYQLDLFAGLDDALEVLFLKHALVDTDDMTAEVQRILAAWRSGDVAAIDEIRQKGLREHPELRPIDELLFARRNREMAEKIAGYLSTGRRHFVIVGAAHLAGEGSIVELLEARGLNVERQ
jgi:uncharacterized protein